MFAPLARVRNFEVKYLDAFINMYPKIMYDKSWGDASAQLDSERKGYKKSYYQQACQMGIEDRSDPNHFRYHVYLETFDKSNLEKYMDFWFKLYYAPNPYVNVIPGNDGKTDDVKPVILYCYFAKKMLESPTLSIDFTESFKLLCGCKQNIDILFNCFKLYGSPIKAKGKVSPNPDVEEEDKGTLYIEPSEKKHLEEIVSFIETAFPIPLQNNRKNFFDRFSYSNFNTYWKITGDPYDVSCEVVKESNLDYYRNSALRVKNGENVILYGVPGSGKSYKIETEYCNNSKYRERVVFHPDYTYADFVGQILPKVDGNRVSYIFTPGPFTKIMKKAWADPGHSYYLVIEELNRGNAPAIFGDIFQLLDRNEDGWGRYEIYNADMSSVIFPNETDQPIQIPSNLSILATMNTSDQNVFTLDNAFQRRWKMRLIHNDFNANGQVKHDNHIKHLIKDSTVTWGSFAKLINSQIAKNSRKMIGAEDKRLGVFFASDSELDSREDFAEKVLKYLWDDAFKMDRGSVDSIFLESFSTFEELIDAYINAEGDPLRAVLRDDIYNGMNPSMTDNG